MTAPDDRDVTATMTQSAMSNAPGGLTDYLPAPPVETPGRRRWIWRVLLLLIAAGLAWGAWHKRDAIAAWRGAKSDGPVSMRFATAKRGDLRIVVTEEGKIRTVNSTRVYP